jgi:hypothetical protein
MRRSYIRKVQGHVGKTKAGWLAALSYFCGVGRVPFPAGVDWVQRHGSMQGSFSNGMNVRTGGGTLMAMNNVIWSWRFQKLVNYAVRVRQRDFDKGFFETRLAGAYTKAGIIR